MELMQRILNLLSIAFAVFSAFSLALVPPTVATAVER